MNNLFFGFLFVFLDFNISFGSTTVGLIPDFIGYILIISGLNELSGQSVWFTRVRPVAYGMAVYTGILYSLDLIGISLNLGYIIFVLGLLSTLVSLYISYGIIMGIKDLEAGLEQNLGSANLMMMWRVLAVLSIAIYVLFLIPYLNLLCVLGGLAAGIAFLVAMYRTRKLYYGG